MSRRDTIIFAVLINTGLLVILFATALKTNDEEGVIVANQQPEVQIAQSMPEGGSQELLGAKGNTDDLLAQIAPQAEPREYAPGMSGGAVAPSMESMEPPALTRSPVVVSEPSPPIRSIAAREPVPEPTRAQDFVEIKVKRGDVLARIAKANGVTVQDIMKANKLTDTRLLVGQALRIPLKSSSAKITDIADNQTTAEGEFYVIRSGDNPWSIAVRHKMDLKELLRINNLDEKSARRLKPGDKLRVR